MQKQSIAKQLIIIFLIINTISAFSMSVKSGIITTHPQNTAVCENQSTYFRIKATGTNLSYQWQKSIDNGIFWSNILSNDTFNYTNSDSIVINKPSYTLNNSLFRCIVDDVINSNSDTSSSAILNVNQVPTIIVEGINNPTCGYVDGWVHLFVTGGLEPYTYYWNTNPPQLTDSLNTVGAGFYKVIVGDQNNCEVSKEIILRNTNLPFSININDIDTTICKWDTVIFTALPDTLDSYIFLVDNDTIQGPSTSASFSTNSLNDGQKIRVIGKEANCTYISDFIEIKVKDSPISDISVGNSQTSFCQGGSVLISAMYNVNYTYQWRNNSIDISGETNNSYNAVSSGSYSVRITNSNGCSAISNSVLITVYPLPVVNVTTVGNSTFCEGDSVIFNANLITGNYYQWKKNGLIIIGATNSQYIAKISGNYSVKITNINNCSDSSAIIPVTVNANPIAEAGINDTICSGNTANIGSTPITNYSYSWTSIPVGFTSNISNPSVSPSITTTYYLTVTNSTTNCSNKDIVVINVKQSPEANITANGQTTFFIGDSVILSANTALNLKYQWKKDNINISGATNSSLVVKQSGNYTVQITNNNLCSTISNSISVSVISTPCNYWLFNNSSWTQNNDIYRSDAANGFEATSVLDEVAPCTTTGCRWVSKTPSGWIIFDFGSKVTLKQFRIFNDFQSNQQPKDCEFQVGNSLTGPWTTVSSYQCNQCNQSLGCNINNQTWENFPIFNPKTSRFWRLKINNSWNSSKFQIAEVGFYGTNSDTLRLNSQISPAGSTEFCDGNSLMLQTSPGSYYTYQWKRDNNIISGAVNYWYLAQTGGSYTVTVMNSQNCTETSAALDVTVHDLPIKPIITKVGDSLVSSYSSGNQWYKNDTIITGAVRSAYTPFHTGFYSVKHKDIHNCMSQMSDKIDIRFQGINDIKEIDFINIYPNPASDNVNIEMGLNNQLNFKVSINNMLNQNLFFESFSLDINYFNKTISLKDFKSGVYYLVIEKDSFRYIKKLLIQK